MAGSDTDGVSVSHLTASASHVTPVISGHCSWPKAPVMGGYCPPVNDTINCWPATAPNTTIFGPCPALHPAQNSTGTCIPSGNTTDVGQWGKIKVKAKAGV
ncbi:uncharacterized protein LOC143294182 [Babylonia areolata]|uniref:uncharacterized protein LOC143294182 n=1 Tax=Babylonia areolata TaxID=304850 RepID=UPI003FD03451